MLLKRLGGFYSTVSRVLQPSAGQCQTPEYYTTADKAGTMRDLDSLRDPTHTGSNRCWPCTVVNVALVSLCVLVLRGRNRKRAGLLLGLAGLAAVYLRGYVVPYTPRFAPKLVAASPLPDAWFHDVVDEDESGSLATDVEFDGETIMRGLGDAGVLTADGEAVVLDQTVDDDWRARMADLSSRSLAGLAAELEQTLPHVGEAEPYTAEGREWIVVGSGTGQLVSRPVAVAELAAYRALGGHLDDQRLRLAAAESFRMFLETCPVCDSDLVTSDETSCCGGYTDPNSTPDETLVCPTCEQRMYTFPSGA